MRFLKRPHRRARRGVGQTTVEYAIIIALVSVAAISAYMALGTQTINLIRAATEKLATGETVTVEQADTSNVKEPSLQEL